MECAAACHIQNDNGYIVEIRVEIETCADEGYTHNYVVIKRKESKNPKKETCCCCPRERERETCNL